MALTLTAATTTMGTTGRRSLSFLRVSSISRVAAGTSDTTLQQQYQQIRWKSSGGNGSKKKPSSHFKGGYYSRLDRNRAMNSFKPKKLPGPKEPNDIKTPLPKIDKSQIRIRDTLDAEEEDDLTPLGTLMGGTLRALRDEAAAAAAAAAQANTVDLDSIESKLKIMDFFTSADGSTEDLVGARRAVSAETYDHSNVSAEEMLLKIDQLVDQERFDYMELPKTEVSISSSGDSSEDLGATSQIPHNQLAHGDW